MPGTLTPSRPPPVQNGASGGRPTVPPPLTEQDLFDAAVNRNLRTALQVLGGAAILAALVMSVVALIVSTGRSDTSARTPAPSAATLPPAAVAPGAASAPASPLIDVSVAGSNKKGPDGKMHDSFSRTDFAVKVGQPTRLRINNTDKTSHSITSTATGISLTVLPGVHTYTLLATKAGRFEWVCVIPCDSDANGWAMTHPGYMAGYITAT